MTGHIAFHPWRDTGLRHGTQVGTTVVEGFDGPAVVIDVPAGRRRYRDPHTGVEATYEWSAWVSPVHETGLDATSLIASWNASTPTDSWLEVQVRVSSDGVTMSRWYILGRWAEGDADIARTSVPGQSDDVAAVDVDVLDTRPGVTFTSYQLRVVLLRRPDSEVTPRLRLVAAMASAVPPETPETSPGDPSRWGIELAVPAYAQHRYRGHYPQWDSGGESWCSPTSTSMVLGYHGALPASEQYDWVDPSLPDRFVPHAVRQVFDHHYGGAGNWAFNAAYAASTGLTAWITRLHSLEEAETYLAAGIPLVATVGFAAGDLDRAGYDTAGHLLTIIGFDEQGNVISNDPAAHGLPDNAEVRVVYDRAQFERVWLRAAGGVVYVVAPDYPAVPG